MKSFESLVRMRDVETKRANASMEAMKMDLNTEIIRLENLNSNLEFSTNNKLSDFAM